MIQTKTVTLSTTAWNCIMAAARNYPRLPLKKDLKSDCIGTCFRKLEAALSDAPIVDMPSDAPFFNYDGTRNLWKDSVHPSELEIQKYRIMIEFPVEGDFRSESERIADTWSA